MSQAEMTGNKTARTVSEQPRRRRSLLDEIQRVKANAAHRRIFKESRSKAASVLEQERAAVEVRVSQPQGIDAAAMRRSWQLRRRLFRMLRVAAATMGLIVGTLTIQNQRLEAAAGSTAHGFLEAGAKDLWGAGRERFFSSWLKQAEPPDRFARDVELLESKLGKLRGFELVRSSVSWTVSQCDLHYEMHFERGSARAFFELLEEDDRWVVDTFAFWSPTWKTL